VFSLSFGCDMRYLSPVLAVFPIGLTKSLASTPLVGAPQSKYCDAMEFLENGQPWWPVQFCLLRDPRPESKESRLALTDPNPFKSSRPQSNYRLCRGQLRGTLIRWTSHQAASNMSSWHSSQKSDSLKSDPCSSHLSDQLFLWSFPNSPFNLKNSNFQGMKIWSQ
jgi:hypothetical protein